MDETGWFSLTPEPIAAFMASYAKDIKDAVIIDGCCSVGGNIIQFGLLPNAKLCVGIELDSERLKFA